MRTSPTQFVMMVEFMERNGDLSKPTGGPRGRQWTTNKWRELSAKLNSDGTGESRSEEKWRKVWTDLKNNTKRKAAKLNRSMSGTGGGPALKLTLTDLELRVLTIMGEQAATGLTAVTEIGFEHVDQVLNLEVDQDVDQINLVTVDDTDLVQQLDPGVEDNLPGTSQAQQSPAPPTASTIAPAKKWTPQNRQTNARKKDLKDGFLEAERDRDRMYYELEKERIRQRDFELELQLKWIAFMNEALNVIKKFMEGKDRDE